MLRVQAGCPRGSVGYWGGRDASIWSRRIGVVGFVIVFLSAHICVLCMLCVLEPL
jgi:hypothetical protein